MSMMSVCAHGRVRKLLNIEVVAEYYAHSQSCEKRPTATSMSVPLQVRPSVRPYELGYRWLQNREISCYLQLSLQRDKSNVHFTWISMSIYEIISLNYFWAEKKIR
jgi:hypothetical protein